MLHFILFSAIVYLAIFMVLDEIFVLHLNNKIATINLIVTIVLVISLLNIY